MKPDRSKSAWILIAVAVASFSAGSLVTAKVATASAAGPESNRVFELRIYHDLPGKLPVMEARFRDKTSKLLAKHNLDVLGYWTAEDRSANAGENTFVFLLAHSNTEEAKKNWKAMVEDPDFQAVEKSELGEKTLEKAELLYMRPTDFSRLK